MFSIWYFFGGVLCGAGLYGLIANIWMLRIIPKDDAPYERID